jgi:hypothetical protein
MGRNGKIMSIRKLVQELSQEQINEIFDNYATFEKEGTVGFCFLCNLADCYLEECGIPKHNVVLWMDCIAVECYRRVAIEAIDSGFVIQSKEE